MGMNELLVRSWGRVSFTAESLPAAVISLITWFYTSSCADDLWIYVWSALSRTLRSAVFNYFSAHFTQKLKMPQITLSRTWCNPASAEALEILPTSFPLNPGCVHGRKNLERSSHGLQNSLLLSLFSLLLLRRNEPALPTLMEVFLCSYN